jgi:hypothetical protein
MARFLVISLALHILLFAAVLGFSFYEPKPKTIQIKLASLPVPNNVKKNTPPPASAIDEKKVEAKKTAEVQKLLDSVLKEDIQEKVIEKSIEEAPKIPAAAAVKPNETPALVKKPQPAPAVPSVVPTQMPPTPAPVVPAPIIAAPITPMPIAPTPKENNAPIISPQNNQAYKMDDTPNPYLSPVVPQAQLPALEEAPAQQQAAESKTPALPPRKIIDVSSAKDDDINAAVSTITEMPADILSKENYSLSDSDKKALSNQISQCLASLGDMRENTETINLMFTMQADAKIKNISVLRGDKVIPPNQQSNLENRVLYLFNSPKCATLILPQGKFTYWQKFTIKINLKGFFE